MSEKQREAEESDSKFSKALDFSLMGLVLGCTKLGLY